MRNFILSQSRFCIFQGSLGICNQPKSAARIPNRACQFSGVNAANPGNSKLFHFLRKSRCTSEIGRFVVVFSDNHSPHGWNFCLIILPSHAIISNKRVCHHHPLVRIRRVRKYLLIPCHRSIKNQLTNPFPHVSKTISFIVHPLKQVFWKISCHLLPFYKVLFSESLFSNRSFLVSSGTAVG